jgi:tripartite-type tricarboxylate transporter receptor subunit TctC
LVIGGTAKLASMPDIPNAAEAGLPAFQAGGWNAFFAPAGTPDPVIKRLNDALRKALDSDAVRKRFVDLSSTVPDADESAPAAVTALIEAEILKYKAILPPVQK